MTTSLFNDFVLCFRKFSTEKSAKVWSVEEKPMRLSEEDYLFVEQPSKDFFCPVTYSLLLQPHLTSCCGNHISQEASSIQREGGACPLCNTHPWNTMFSKHFRRQVKLLQVFCCYENRGCEWQGELARYEEHILSCPNKPG